jgi:hypothetical protein
MSGYEKADKKALAEAARRKLGRDSGSHVPPQSVRSNASRGLEMRREHGRGGLSPQEAHEQGIGSGVSRAATLASGKAVPTETVKRMHAYFARHEKDKQAEGFREGEKGYPSAGRVAWDLWGGDAGKAWADSIAAKDK